MKTIGIVGSRRRNTPDDYQKVRNTFFEIYEEGDWICSGGCPKGGDHFAYTLAKETGIPIVIFFPDWKTYGKGAGFVRNGSIAKTSDTLIACIAEDRKGGTEDTINKFQKMKPDNEVILV